MIRLIVILFVLATAASCSNKNNEQPPVVIPDKIEGPIVDIMFTPVDINTPDKGTLLVAMNNVVYKVEFNAIAQAQSNARLDFLSDTILRDNSREFSNLGKDVIAYNPIGPNEIVISFYDGRRVLCWFEPYSTFGGTFGETLIATWREPTDPAKPTQKAKTDLSRFVTLYSDKDGSGPGAVPVYLSAQITKQ